MAVDQIQTFQSSDQVAAPFNSLIERREWQHIYGAAHYYFNAQHRDLPAEVERVKVFDCIAEAKASEIIKSDFKEKAEVDLTPNNNWKFLNEPFEESFYKADYVEFSAQDQTRLLEVANSLLVTAQNFYRCYLSIAKVRLFRVRKGFEQHWHRDQFPAGIHKLLIYLSGASQVNGTTEIRLSANETTFVEGKPGSGVIFDTNVIEHRGLGPTGAEYRYSIEFTFVPAFEHTEIKKLPETPFGGLWPKTSKELRAKAEAVYKIMGIGGGANKADIQKRNEILKFNSENPPTYLNLGGGPSFLEKGWRNVDGAFGELNPYPMQFDVNSKLGLPVDNMEFVYSSHFLEHLDQLTFGRVISEVSRVLKTGGLFFVKIPGFDELLEGIRNGSFPSGYHRALCGLQSTWHVHRVSLSAWQIFSFMICSAWNHEYSDNYFQQNRRKDKANGYFGPVPNLEDKFIEQLSSDLSLNELGAFLRRKFIEFQNNTKTAWTFNHQNAWSTKELIEQVSAYGFEAISTERDDIVKKLGGSVPRFFMTQRDVSTWVLFRKT